MAGTESSVIAQCRKALDQLPYFTRALWLIWHAARGWVIAWLALLLVQGILPAGTVILTRSVVNSLVAAKSAGGSWESLRPVLILVAIMAGILLAGEVLRSLSDWIRTAQSQLVQDHINSLIHEKSVTVDLAFYESADFYDRLHRACTDASTRPLSLLESVGGLLQNGVTFLAMAAVLLPYGAWLPGVLVASTAPAFFVVFRFNRRYHRWWEQTTADRRWVQYYDRVLTLGAIAAELRLFELGDHFRLAYQVLRRRLRHEHLALTRDQGLAKMGAGSVGLVISGAAMAWMTWRVLQGATTLGDLALFYQAFNQGQGLLRSLLGNLGQIYSNTLFLGNLFEFLSLEPRIVSPRHPVPMSPDRRRSICFRHVTFHYPKSERPALRSLDLVVPAGQIAAIVGANGAGKSTLVKLLCRFYDPDDGQIELDGVDLREMSIEELRRHITVQFQVPGSYHATARENIAMGDLRSAPTDAEIEEAARWADVHEIISRLPRGYDTLLGKWFAEGTDLSGGEWQRVVLARILLRRAPIIVLDEPTSFIDSWAELRWLDRLRALTAGRTALIITHRLTTARRADVIHVMDAGRIVESGTHAELVRLDGLYAQSWKQQMQEIREYVGASAV